MFGLIGTDEFDKAVAGLKFRAGYPESVQKTLLSSAKSAILGAYTPDWVEADGQRIMVFRDKNGERATARSPLKLNALSVYTSSNTIIAYLFKY